MSELPKPEASEADASNVSGKEFIDLLIIWAKWKKFIIGLTACAALYAVISSLLMPNIYQSTLRLLPPQQAQSNATALLAQLGGMAGGLASSITKNPNDIYVAMIKSRTIGDAMVDRFALLSVYGVKSREQARRQLEGNTKVVNGKDGMISIDVSDTDPKRASILANGYGEELLKMTRDFAVTQTSKTRLFFERQLKISKDKLNDEEEKLKEHLQSSGVISVDNQSRTLLEMAARLRAEMASKEIQIAAMKPFVTENNVSYQRHLHALSSAKEALHKLENGSTASKADRPNGATNDGIGSMQLLRDVKYHQVLYEILAKQYEASRLDEARDVAIIQVLDKAVAPETKIAPRRSVIVLAITILTFLLALLLALVFEYVQKLRGQPEMQRKIGLLKGHIIGSRRV